MTDTDPNAAVVNAAQTAASDIRIASNAGAEQIVAAVNAGYSVVATAVQADAERLAVKDEVKASSWIHRELHAFEAKIATLFAEFRAKL